MILGPPVTGVAYIDDRGVGWVKIGLNSPYLVSQDLLTNTQGLEVALPSRFEPGIFSLLHIITPIQRNLYEVIYKGQTIGGGFGAGYALVEASPPGGPAYDIRDYDDPFGIVGTTKVLRVYDPLINNGPGVYVVFPNSPGTTNSDVAKAMIPELNALLTTPTVVAGTQGVLALTDQALEDAVVHGQMDIYLKYQAVFPQLPTYRYIQLNVQKTTFSETTLAWRAFLAILSPTGSDVVSVSAFAQQTSAFTAAKQTIGLAPPPKAPAPPQSKGVDIVGLGFLAGGALLGYALFKALTSKRRRA